MHGLIKICKPQFSTISRASIMQLDIRSHMDIGEDLYEMQEVCVENAQTLFPMLHAALTGLDFAAMAASSTL